VIEEKLKGTLAGAKGKGGETENNMRKGERGRERVKCGDEGGKKGMEGSSQEGGAWSA